jgi:TolA-binding protein
MQEYLTILEEAPQQLQFVKRRFGQFSGQDDAITASIPVVERAIRREPLNRTFRELAAWLYLKAGDYTKALDANRAIDRLEKEDGRTLLVFARDATQAEAFDAAAAAYEEILERYPDAPTSASAQFLLARLNVQKGESLHERAYDSNGNRIPAPHFDKALESYRHFTQKYPYDPRVPDALLQIGQLQLDIFFDLGASESLLTDIINRYPETDSGFYARFDLGKIALMRSDLRRARVLFSRLEDELRIGELAELARFEMAQIDFYTGQFESALTLVQALDANTSTDIANDAIALKVLLRENKGPDSLNTPLRYYATAQLLHRQRQFDAALKSLDTLSTRFAGHALTDETLFLRAEILRATGAAAQGLATLNQLVENHPESYLADRSLFLTGELYEQELNDPSGALEVYTTLLTTFPGSLLAPEARARIRALRGDGV